MHFYVNTKYSKEKESKKFSTFEKYHLLHSFKNIGMLYHQSLELFYTVIFLLLSFILLKMYIFINKIEKDPIKFLFIIFFPSTTANKKKNIY